MLRKGPTCILLQNPKIQPKRVCLAAISTKAAHELCIPESVRSLFSMSLPSVTFAEGTVTFSPKRIAKDQRTTHRARNSNPMADSDV